MTAEFHRTNINLHTTDVEFLRRRFGYGWTEAAREIVHKWVKSEKALDRHKDLKEKLDHE